MRTNWRNCLWYVVIVQIIYEVVLWHQLINSMTNSQPLYSKGIVWNLKTKACYRICSAELNQMAVVMPSIVRFYVDSNITLKFEKVLFSILLETESRELRKNLFNKAQWGMSSETVHPSIWLCYRKELLCLRVGKLSSKPFYILVSTCCSHKFSDNTILNS